MVRSSMVTLQPRSSRMVVIIRPCSSVYDALDRAEVRPFPLDELDEDDETLTAELPEACEDALAELECGPRRT